MLVKLGFLVMSRVLYGNNQFNISCRQHPGQYEYYKNYDDLEASYTIFYASEMNLFLKLLYSDSVNDLSSVCNRFTSVESISFVKMKPALPKNLSSFKLKPK